MRNPPLAMIRYSLKKEFRSGDGTAVRQKNLQLRLQDFLPSTIEASIEALEQEIEISYEKLAECLNGAEKRKELIERKQGISESLPNGTRKRRRSSIPPEELTTEDERELQA